MNPKKSGRFVSRLTRSTMAMISRARARTITARSRRFRLRGRCLSTSNIRNDAALNPAVEVETGLMEDDCKAVMHHYVAGSKPWYFRHNWRRHFSAA